MKILKTGFNLFLIIFGTNCTSVSKLKNNVNLSEIEYASSAHEWFVHGHNTNDLNLKVKYYSNAIKAIQLNPDNADFYSNRGNAYKGLKKYHQGMHMS